MTDFYVSPQGSATSAGTIDDPWSLAYACAGAGGVIQPGDTIWMRGGTYSQPTAFTIEVTGSLGSGVDNPDGKIKFRNYPRERAILITTDEAIEVVQVNGGGYVWLWGSFGQDEGFEVYRPTLTRNDVRGTNIWIAEAPQSGTKVINVVTHDGSNGILDGGFNATYDYGELEIYGVVAYNNGELQMSGDDEGLVTHNYYLRHQGSTTKLRITKCIGFNPMGYNFHCWAEHADGLRNIELTDCIAWGGGKLKFLTGVEVANIIMAGANGVGAPTRGCVCSRNMLLQLAQDSGAGLMILGGLSNTINEGLTVEDNYMVGGEYDTFFAPVRLFQFQAGGVGDSLSFNRNEIISWTDAHVIENTQSGSLAGYASWQNNKFHVTSSMIGFRHGGVDKDFPTWKADTGLGASDETGYGWYPGQPGGSLSFPHEAKVFVIPADKYDPGIYSRVCFYNWGKEETVGVDLSTVLSTGDRYEVYNVQDIFGAPVLQGTYMGGEVEFPTTGKTPPQPIGFTPRPPVTTAPFFDAFVVKKVETLTMAPSASVTNYNSLIASVESWANRDDLDATVIPDWIAFFEARARRELRDWLTSTLTLTNLTQDTLLPTTVEEVLSVAYNDGSGGVQNQPLDLLSFEEYHRRMSSDSSVRTPVQGVYPDRDEAADSYVLRFYPPISASSPLANLVVLVAGALPGLSTTQPTNRLLTSNPDLYVKGALIEGAEFLQHDERIPVWAEEVKRTIKQLQLQTERKRMGASPHPVQLPVRFG